MSYQVLENQMRSVINNLPSGKTFFLEILYQIRLHD